MQGNYKDIIKIAAPVILGSIAQTSISVADTAMLGKVGEIELAAIGIVSLYYLLLFMIGFAYTKGTQILVARRIGEGNMDGVGAVFDNSLAVIMAMGVALMLFIRFCADPIMTLLVKDEAVRAAGVAFLELRSFGIFFSLVGSVFLSFYMGIGRMKLLVFNVLSMAIINILLNWLLIHGHWGFPAMGVRGSAMASNIAEMFAAGVFTIYTFWGGFHKKYHLFHVSKLSWRIVYNISSLSAPIVAQTLIGLVAWSVFFYFIEKMGSYDTAISSAAKNIYMFFGLFAWGFSTSANTIISTLMGKQLHSRVVEAIKNIVILSFISQAIIVLPIVFAPEAVLSLYTNDAALIRDTVPVLYVCVAALLVYSVSTILFHCIVSTGSVKSSFVIEVITIAVYMVYIYWIFSVPWRTVTIVWTSEVFYWLLLAVCTIIYLRTGKWKTTRI